MPVSIEEEFLRVYDEKFRTTYGPLHPRIKDLLEAFTRCGDPHFGFLRLRRCNADCGDKTERIVPFSCKEEVFSSPRSLSPKQANADGSFAEAAASFAGA